MRTAANAGLHACVYVATHCECSMPPERFPSAVMGFVVWGWVEDGRDASSLSGLVIGGIGKEFEVACPDDDAASVDINQNPSSLGNDIFAASLTAAPADVSCLVVNPPT